MGGLGNLHAKSANVVATAVPFELLQHVDEGKPPDGLTIEMHRRVSQMSEGLQGKQHGMRHLEETITVLASDLLQPKAAGSETG